MAKKTQLTVQQVGKLGGEATKKRQGKKFYSKIGQKGGLTTRDHHAPDYFSRIGRLGGIHSAKKKKK